MSIGHFGDESVAQVLTTKPTTTTINTHQQTLKNSHQTNQHTGVHL